MLLFFIHHLLWHRQLPQLGQMEDPISALAEVVLRLLLGIPSAAEDLNLLEKEISWKGEVGGSIKPLKAMVLQGTVMHPPHRLHHSPNQLWATTVQVPMVGRHGQVGGLPR